MCSKLIQLFFFSLSSFLSVGLFADEIGRENQIYEIANLLNTPGVEFGHCAKKMRALYEDLPRHETPDLSDTQLNGLVDLLGEAYFNFGDRSQEWFSSGQISRENVELFSSFNRVLLHALGEALFLQKVIRPLQLAGRLNEYDPLKMKKSEPVVFLAAPLKEGARFDSEGRLLNLSELLPEVVFASMRGGRNSFVSPLIARLPQNDLQDGLVSHSFVLSRLSQDIHHLTDRAMKYYRKKFKKLPAGTPVVAEALIENGALLYTDPKHADPIYRVSQGSGLIAMVAPANQEAAVLGMDRMFQEMVNRPAPHAYNSSMAPGQKDALFCSEICWQVMKMGLNNPNYTPFFMTEVDLGSDQVHEKLGITRGVSIYAPRDVLIDPQNSPLVLVFDPEVFHQAQVADDVMDVLNELEQEIGLEYKTTGYHARMMRWFVHPFRSLLRDWPPYEFMGHKIPLLEKLRSSAPSMSRDQMIFMGARQTPYLYLINKKVLPWETSIIKSSGTIPSRESRREFILEIIVRDLRFGGSMRRWLKSEVIEAELLDDWPY